MKTLRRWIFNPLRLSTLSRYIFREILSPSLLGLGVYMLVLVTNVLFELAEFAIKRDVPTGSVVRILFYVLPQVLAMSIPMAILLGVLIGVGRLSADSEVIAMRAGGISYWRILFPALIIGLAGCLISGYLKIESEPRADYNRRRIFNTLLYSADLRREIKPRVFFEEIPGMLLYADEVKDGGAFLDRVFIYQSQPDGKELVTLASRAQIEYDRLTGVAKFYLEDGTTHSTSPTNPEGYQVSNFERQMIVRAPDEAFRIRSDMLAHPGPKGLRQQSLAELAERAREFATLDSPETRRRVLGQIDAIRHERFALPVACLVFALVGVPLGIMNRRGGRASGFTLSIGIGIVYWVLLTTGQNLVSQGMVPAPVGLWFGNVLLGLLGIVLFILRERNETLQFNFLVPNRLQTALKALRRREEMERDRQRLGEAGAPAGSRPPIETRRFLRRAGPFGRRRRSTRASRNGAEIRGVPGTSPTPLTPAPGSELEDASAVEMAFDDFEERQRFLSRRIRTWIGFGIAILAVVLALSYSPFFLVGLIFLAILFMFSTTLDRYIIGRYTTTLTLSVLSFFTLFAVYEFIKLIDDLVERSLPVTLAFRYLGYRSPWILSQVLPMSCLVATFLAIGFMSRFNEVTALKASGTSIYRVAAPVLFITLAVAALGYVNQDYLVPSTNQRAARLQDTIRGRSARSYQSGENRWVFGDGGRLFNFKSYLASPLAVLPGTGGSFQGFSMYRLDTATASVRERIYSRLATYAGGHWVLKDGWVRDFGGGEEAFESFVEKRFDFPETPGYFIKEWKSPQQMTFGELRVLVRDLRKRGYDVQELMVDLHDKTALPLVSLTMVVLGLPFCFRIGSRGSLYGIGVAVLLAGVYLVVFSATNALGGVGILPPFLAAWAPNILFAGSGFYLLLKTGT